MSDQASGGLLSPFLQRRRIAQAVPFLRGRILDYGCGNGELFGELTPAQRDHYVGFDPDAEVIAAARARFPAARLTDRIEELGAAFDSVASLAVIEHVPSVPAYLATLHRLLADEGEAVLTSPRQSIDLVHRVGARLGLFSREANEEHNEYVSERTVAGYCAPLGLELRLFRSFLLGANQLFVLRRVGRV